MESRWLLSRKAAATADTSDRLSLTHSGPLDGMSSAYLALHLLVILAKQGALMKECTFVMRPTPHLWRNGTKLSQGNFLSDCSLQSASVLCLVVERSICDHSFLWGIICATLLAS